MLNFNATIDNCDLNFELTFNESVKFASRFNFYCPFYSLGRFLEEIIEGKDTSILYEFEIHEGISTYTSFIHLYFKQPNIFSVEQRKQKFLTVQNIDKYEFVKLIYEGFMSINDEVKKMPQNEPLDDDDFPRLQISELKSKKVEKYIKSKK